MKKITKLMTTLALLTAGVERVDATTVLVADHFGNEITSIDYLTGGNKFVITDGANVLYFSSNQDAKSAALASVPSDSYFYYTLTKIEGLDLDNDGTVDNDIYAINIINEDGTAFPAPWNLGNCVNFTNWGSIFSGSAQPDKGKGYGTDTQYQGIWKLAYSAGNGFSFKNCSLNKYLKVNGSQDEPCYLKLYESIVFENSTIVDIEKVDNEANDEIFALSKAEGYDAETGVLTNGTWTFDTPVSIADWDYIMITTVSTAADASHEIAITDANGKTVKGEDYSGSVAETGGNMWLDRWNNQNAIRISIDYLRVNKLMDISKIQSLSISGTIKIANIYLTDYNNTKISGGYKDGDVKREYTETGKFGTICLPYVASCAGAEVYSIASMDANGIGLAKVAGLLEAGKPYFYMSADENGQNNEKAVLNVNFFRADLEKFDAAAPGEDNGLIGTFDDMAAPQGSNFWVLSDNKLYKVDSDVAVEANNAYVDASKISNTGVSVSTAILFDATTGITSVEKQQNSEAIYNINGQRVNQLNKGLYILNGKKMIVR